MSDAAAGLAPHERGLTPHERGLTPHERGLTPHERGLTPHERGLTPSEVFSKLELTEPNRASNVLPRCWPQRRDNLVFAGW